MLTTIRAAALALALMAAAALGGPARAQTPEAEALGVQVAHVIFASIGFKDLITKEMAKEGGLEIKSRPEWDGFLAESLTEEVSVKMPAIEAMVGHALAQKLTVPELKAGLIVFSDPSIQAGIAAEAAGKPNPNRPPQPAALRAASTPEGQSFLTKMGDVDAVLAPLEDEFIAVIMPGAMRRLADKMEASERARAAKR